MVGFRLAPIPFALCILALAGCTPAQPTRAPSQPQVPPAGPGMARVWFFRQTANWETGHTGGSSFAVETSSPDVAQQYIPTLTNLGQR
jgi:hypothetical protein